MKHWLIISGGIFLVLGLFYDAMPVELIGAISQIFSSNSGSMHFRVVPTEQIDLLQVSLLFIGIGFIIAGIFLRRAKSRP